MSNEHDPERNEFMLTGSLANEGYDWWWHSFTGYNRKNGEERNFFIEYFTCNPGLGGKEPILGQLPENKEKGVKPSYVMVKAGSWGRNKSQLHRFFGWEDVILHPKAPFSLLAADCYASDTELKGSICLTKEEALAHPEYMSDSGSMKWDLKVDKKIAFNVGYGAGEVLRDIKAFEMYWHAEGMKTEYSGTVTYNGVEYAIDPETSFGYADKNWGRDFTSPWVWLSSCCLKSKLTGKELKNSAFDIGGGRPKVYDLPLERKLLGAFTYEGEDYEFNFSKFWTHSKTWFESQETDTQVIWDVRQETKEAMMVTHITCEKEDMLLVNYEAPNGSKLHNRLWNGGNGRGEIQLYKKDEKGTVLIDVIEATHVGCEYGEYDHE